MSFLDYPDWMPSRQLVGTRLIFEAANTSLSFTSPVLDVSQWPAVMIILIPHETNGYRLQVFSELIEKGVETQELQPEWYTKLAAPIKVVVPCLANNMQLVVTADNDAVNPKWDLIVWPLATVFPPAAPTDNLDIINLNQQSIASGGTSVAFAASAVVSGEAVWSVQGPQASWTAELRRLNRNSATRTVMDQVVIASPSSSIIRSVLLPRAVCEIQVTNNDSISHTYDITLIAKGA